MIHHFSIATFGGSYGPLALFLTKEFTSPDIIIPKPTGKYGYEFK